MPFNNCREHSRKSDRYISTPVQNKSPSSNSRSSSAAGTREGTQPILSERNHLLPLCAPRYPTAPAPMAQPRQRFHSPVIALKSQLEHITQHRGEEV